MENAFVTFRCSCSRTQFSSSPIAFLADSSNVNGRSLYALNDHAITGFERLFAFDGKRGPCRRIDFDRTFLERAATGRHNASDLSGQSLDARLEITTSFLSRKIVDENCS